MKLFKRTALLAGVACLAAGCVPLQKPSASKPLLAPAQLPPDSAVFEVFFVRCPLDDARLNKTLWNDVDEQSFAAESRRLWLKNGFRIGLVAGPISDTLAALLAQDAEAKDESPQAKKKDAEAPAAGENQVDLMADPKVVARRLSLRPGQRSEILASAVYDEWPVLTSEGGQVSGQTYLQAQGLFAMRIVNERDGRVRLKLTPEMSHGQMRQRWVGDQGVMRLEAGKPKKTFEDLLIETSLTPGQILLATALPNRQGSLGYYFFTDKQSEKAEQKLLVVRLTQTQHNDITASAEAASK